MSANGSPVGAALGPILASATPGGIEDVAAACGEDPELAAGLEAAAEARPSLLGDLWA